jgi:hypothetical protein
LVSSSFWPIHQDELGPVACKQSHLSWVAAAHTVGSNSACEQWWWDEGVVARADVVARRGMPIRFSAPRRPWQRVAKAKASSTWCASAADTRRRRHWELVTKENEPRWWHPLQSFRGPMIGNISLLGKCDEWMRIELQPGRTRQSPTASRVLVVRLCSAAGAYGYGSSCRRLEQRNRWPPPYTCCIDCGAERLTQSAGATSLLSELRRLWDRAAAEPPLPVASLAP